MYLFSKAEFRLGVPHVKTAFSNSLHTKSRSKNWSIYPAKIARQTRTHFKVSVFHLHSLWSKSCICLFDKMPVFSKDSWKCWLFVEFSRRNVFNVIKRTKSLKGQFKLMKKSKVKYLFSFVFNMKQDQIAFGSMITRKKSRNKLINVNIVVRK